MTKCRKCREGKKHSQEYTPKRPPRGSIRAAKRAQQRENKMAALAKATDNLSVESGSSDTVS